jgi:hypothetical protein
MASIAGLMSSPIHDKPASVITSPLKPLLAVTDVGLHDGGGEGAVAVGGRGGGCVCTHLPQPMSSSSAS